MGQLLLHMCTININPLLIYFPIQVLMVKAIPGLINVIRMIHSFSLYYNTSERITSLFVKVRLQEIQHYRQSM